MGLLDSNLMNDPQSLGLLSAGAGMFNASGPSLMPHSLGQVFGQGLSGYVQGNKTAIDNQRAEIAAQLQNAQLMQALRQGEITQQVYQRALAGMNGGGQGGTQPSDQDPTAGSFGSPPIGAGGRAGNGGGGMFGLNNNAVLGGMLAGPGELGKAIVSANSPTEYTKLLQQSGIDPNSTLGRQLYQQNIAKTNYIAPANIRPGGYTKEADGTVEQYPHVPEGFQAIKGQDGQWNIVPVAGGTNAMQASSAATAAGKNSVEPIQAYNGTQPVFTNKLTAALGGGQTGASTEPFQGANLLSQLPPQVAAGILQNAKEGDGRFKVNYQLSNGRRITGDVDLNSQGGQSSQSSSLAPGLAPGMAESQTSLATAGSKRYNDQIALAADSPTRVNVYDNILNLSKQGVDTGPGQEWKNAIKGYVSNTPILGSVAGSWKDDVAGFTELKKFMAQNAQRNWQAAGGTGTDSQLQAFENANPNDKMFPKALQAMAQWGKAGELALQAKTNALQNWKDQQGGNVVNQDQFERAWRNNFDPMIFQLKTMSPAEAQDYVTKLKATNPNAYSNLMLKANALKNIGGL